jgi:hypothetical protein
MQTQKVTENTVSGVLSILQVSFHYCFVPFLPFPDLCLEEAPFARNRKKNSPNYENIFRQKVEMLP